MDEERKSDLQFAYETLVKHNLWRRGLCEYQNSDPKNLSRAIDIAAGALLDFHSFITSYANNTTRLHAQLEQQECIAISTKDMLDDARREIRRLRAILAAHGINYSKDKLHNPAPKKLTQKVFKEFGKEYRFATVDPDGQAKVWIDMPVPTETGWVAHGHIPYLPILAGFGYDTSDWQNSLLEREDRPDPT